MDLVADIQLPVGLKLRQAEPAPHQCADEPEYSRHDQEGTERWENKVIDSIDRLLSFTMAMTLPRPHGTIIRCNDLSARSCIAGKSSVYAFSAEGNR